jgi:rhomboid protease GluP
MAIPATWLTRVPHEAPPRANGAEHAYNSAVTEEAAPKSVPAAASPDNAEAARGFKGAPVSAALLAANIGVFLAQVFLAGDAKYALSMPDAVLRWLGANASLWTISDNRFETLVTSCFLHASVLHLGLNMLVLWQVGPLLERAIGSARFLPLYLVGGIVGSASSAIWGRFFGQTVSVGASGALCGLIAAATVVGVRTEGWRGELTIGMGRWLGLIVLIGLVRTINPNISQIDNAAHIGGALGGAVVAATWQRGFTYARSAQRTILLASVALVVAAGGIVYVRNRTDPYLFMNVEERMRAAEAALQAGHCDRARTAVDRAMRMDPQNRSIRAEGSEIARECWDPNSDKPTPRLRH